MLFSRSYKSIPNSQHETKQELSEGLKLLCGSNVNVRGVLTENEFSEEDLTKALHENVRVGNIDTVNALLTHEGEQPQLRLFGHTTPLLKALQCLEGDTCVQMVQVLLRTGVDVNERAEVGVSAPSMGVYLSLGETPLIFCTEQSCNDLPGYYIDIIKLLLNHKKDSKTYCDAGIRDVTGCTAAHSAAKLENLKILRILLEYDPSLLTYTDSAGESILNKCGTHTDFSIARYLLNVCPALIKMTNVYGNNMLHNAVFEDNIDFLKLLLDKSRDPPNINDQNNEGRTPLIIGALFDYPDIVKYLLTFPEIDLDLVDSRGWTALRCARKFGSSSISHLHQQSLYRWLMATRACCLPDDVILIIVGLDDVCS